MGSRNRAPGEGHGVKHPTSENRFELVYLLDNVGSNFARFKISSGILCCEVPRQRGPAT